MLTTNGNLWKWGKDKAQVLNAAIKENGPELKLGKEIKFGGIRNYVLFMPKVRSKKVESGLNEV